MGPFGGQPVIVTWLHFFRCKSGFDTCSSYMIPGVVLSQSFVAYKCNEGVAFKCNLLEYR